MRRRIGLAKETVYAHAVQGRSTDRFSGVISKRRRDTIWLRLDDGRTGHIVIGNRPAWMKQGQRISGFRGPSGDDQLTAIPASGSIISKAKVEVWKRGKSMTRLKETVMQEPCWWCKGRAWVYRTADPADPARAATGRAV